MSGRRTGVIVAAIGALWAGNAGAAIVTATTYAEFFSVEGPAGWYPQPSGPPGGFVPYVFFAGSRESVYFPIGGVGWSSTFTFSTDLGTLTTGPAFQQLSWTNGQGPSPLLSGEFVWPVAGIDLSLAGATSFSTLRNALGFGFSFIGPGYSLVIPAPFVGNPTGAVSLTDPLQSFCGCTVTTAEGYSDALWRATSTEVAQQSIVALPAPEPATWTLMILGIGLAGSALRRARATFGLANRDPSTKAVR